MALDKAGCVRPISPAAFMMLPARATASSSRKSRKVTRLAASSKVFMGIAPGLCGDDEYRYREHIAKGKMRLSGGRCREGKVMSKLFATCAALVVPVVAGAQSLAGATGERTGITAIARHVFDDATMPGKEFRVLHTTYAPGGQNPKHYHPSHVVFYVLEGSGVWQKGRMQ